MLYKGEKRMDKLFTHTDLDGIGCAFFGKLAFANLDIEYCENKEVDEKISNFFSSGEYKKYNRTFITDISISDSIALMINKKINDEGLIVRLIDHHKTADFLNKYQWCMVIDEWMATDINQETHAIETKLEKTSATRLFYITLKELELIGNDPKWKTLSIIISNWDTWKWKELGESGMVSKNMNSLFEIYGREDFLNFLTDTNQWYPNFSEEVTKILDIYNKGIEDYILEKNKTMIKINNNQYHIGVVFADRCQSELGNRLCEMNSDIDLIAMIDMSSSKIGFRTIKDDVDVAEYAKSIGGGGHQKASGAPFDSALINNFIKNIL